MNNKTKQLTEKNITSGQNVIIEMEAENNDDESYYLSQSPIRKGR